MNKYTPNNFPQGMPMNFMMPPAGMMTQQSPVSQINIGQQHAMMMQMQMQIAMMQQQLQTQATNIQPPRLTKGNVTPLKVDPIP